MIIGIISQFTVWFYSSIENNWGYKSEDVNRCKMQNVQYIIHHITRYIFQWLFNGLCGLVWGNTTKMSALSVKTNVHFLLMSALHWAAAPSLLNAGTRSRQGYKQKICRNVPRVVYRYVDSVDM